ncbi:MAG: YidC/Oxa1 family membrane protein insertase [Butyrivibrio sp.]|nr:YidC/Oxa1 family membrane protein insertase [Butyrivibrio sp.]
MTGVLLTQYQGSIIGPVAKLLGILMNGIFNILNAIGIPNIGLSIVLFTFLIYLCLMPLTIKQQKFSKLQAKMSPELQAIQAKYKGKKDNDSMLAQQQEVKDLYGKYGVSQTGSCVQLLIQMPILFALYRVIYSMPAYVTQVGDTFRVLANSIINNDNGQFLLNSELKSVTTAVSMYKSNLTDDNMVNGIVDILNKMSSADLSTISEHYGLSNLTYNGSLILSNSDTVGLIDRYNNFLGLNIGNSPQYLLTNAFESKSFILFIAAIAVPVLAALTQFINVKLMPQASNSTASDPNDPSNQMMQSMKTMNLMMPIMSAFFCFTLPAGMGLYWIAGSVIRSVQQILINHHIDKMDIDAEIAKNQEKYKKKQEKQKERTANIDMYAKLSTKNMDSNNAVKKVSSVISDAEKEAGIKNANDTYNNGNIRKNSLLSMANMVKEYDERNNK